MKYLQNQKMNIILKDGNNEEIKGTSIINMKEIITTFDNEEKEVNNIKFESNLFYQTRNQGILKGYISIIDKKNEKEFLLKNQFQYEDLFNNNNNFENSSISSSSSSLSSSFSINNNNSIKKNIIIKEKKEEMNNNNINEDKEYKKNLNLMIKLKSEIQVINYIKELNQSLNSFNQSYNNIFKEILNQDDDYEIFLNSFLDFSKFLNDLESFYSLNNCVIEKMLFFNHDFICIDGFLVFKNFNSIFMNNYMKYTLIDINNNITKFR
jgi:hypothetical protein